MKKFLTIIFFSLVLSGCKITHDAFHLSSITPYNDFTIYKFKSGCNTITLIDSENVYNFSDSIIITKK